ncbi:MAG TPA: sterol desaturase family protein [Candidatus Eisenbacteria bacterium]|nr:sterol desaturase family protein [Candidatus Eisenbacteria bacterium]
MQKAGTKHNRDEEQSPLGRELPAWLTGALVVGTFAAVLWLEIRRPLRAQTRRKLRRDARNLALAALSATTITVLEKPIVRRLSQTVNRRRWGLTKCFRLPPWAEVGAAVVLLDYTLYVWHVLTHKAPVLARFHRVHHADLDMDASTALRFHFGEMIFSIPWRAAQVLVVGAAPLSLSLWQTLTTMAIIFHHSNWRLPYEIERRLCRFIVTPRMHGIHHSIILEETDANWGTIFSFPDFLHRTVRLNVPQQKITIGLPLFRDENRLTLGHLLMMPITAGDPSAERPAEWIKRNELLPLPESVLAENHE